MTAPPARPRRPARLGTARHGPPGAPRAGQGAGPPRSGTDTPRPSRQGRGGQRPRCGESPPPRRAAPGRPQAPLPPHLQHPDAAAGPGPAPPRAARRRRRLVLLGPRRLPGPRPGPRPGLPHRRPDAETPAAAAAPPRLRAGPAPEARGLPPRRPRGCAAAAPGPSGDRAVRPRRGRRTQQRPRRVTAPAWAARPSARGGADPEPPNSAFVRLRPRGFRSKCGVRGSSTR